MDAVTSIVDVIEEFSGVDLIPSNLHIFEKFSNDDFSKLALSIYQHTSSEYLRIPTFEEGQICCVFHPESSYTKDLGGVGRGPRERITKDKNDLKGMLLLTLLYYPKVAVHDGLEYFLDFFYYRCATNEHRQIVLNLLGFYAEVRELIKNYSLIIIPRTIWGKFRGSNSNFKFNDLILDELSQTAFIKKHPLRDDREIIKMFSNDFLEIINEDERISRIVSFLIFYDRTKYLNELLLFCSSFNYNPIIETKESQLIFKVLINKIQYTLNNDISGSVQLINKDLYIPLLNKLSIKDFLDIHRADSFVLFRETIEKIDRKASSLIHSPIDLKEMMNLELNKSKEKIVNEISSSNFLSSSFDEFFKAGVGVIAGSNIASHIKPEWGDDPWKLALIGGISGMASVSSSLIKYASNQYKYHHTSRLFFKILK